MQHLYPQPTPKGIARTVALYREKYGREITEDEARRILLPVMRFLHLGAHPLTAEEEERAAWIEAEAAAQEGRSKQATGIKAYPEKG